MFTKAQETQVLRDLHETAFYLKETAKELHAIAEEIKQVGEAIRALKEKSDESSDEMEDEFAKLKAYIADISESR